jgi:hypothetical protein
MMSYTFEPNKRYFMPPHFGPAPQWPVAHYGDLTQFTILYSTNKDALTALLPEPYKGREYCLKALHKSFRRATFGYFYWDFRASSREIQIEGRISAKSGDFVCLRYYNPSGGIKYCLNTKIAACQLTLRLRGDTKSEVLETPYRAAFEILTDKNDHGLIPAV